MALTDEQIARLFWAGREKVRSPHMSERDLAGYRAVEAAATAPLLERIAALEASEKLLSVPIPDKCGARTIVLSNDQLRQVLRKESTLLPAMFDFVVPRWLQIARVVETAVIRRLIGLGYLDQAVLGRQPKTPAAPTATTPTTTD